MFAVHLPNGFSSIKLRAISAAGAEFGAPGYELNLLYLAGLLTLCLGGSGPASIDGLLGLLGLRRAKQQCSSVHAGSCSNASSDQRTANGRGNQLRSAA